MLDRFFARVLENRDYPASGPVLIVALGDSVTQGCMEAGVTDYRHVYHRVLQAELETRWPGTIFSLINAGVGGQTAAGGQARLERDVIRPQPDLVICGFCLNDCGAGAAGLNDYRQRLLRIAREIKSRTLADLIFLTPNFIASRDNERVAEVHRGFATQLIARQTDGTLAAYVRELRAAAAEVGAPVADVYAAWEKLAAAGVDTTARLCNGLNHPDQEGQRLIGTTILELLDRARRGGDE